MGKVGYSRGAIYDGREDLDDDGYTKKDDNNKDNSTIDKKYPEIVTRKLTGSLPEGFKPSSGYLEKLDL